MRARTQPEPGWRSMTVVCLRHRGAYPRRADAWRALSGYLFERGLCGPDTRAVGVLYDDPAATPGDKVRYDVCLSVDPAQWAEVDLTDIETVRLGLRLDVILGDPRLHHLDLTVDGAGGKEQPAPAAPWRSGRTVRWPVYELYPRSPAFLPGDATPSGYYYAAGAGAPGEAGVDR